jgi:hypothetical protein
VLRRSEPFACHLFGGVADPAEKGLVHALDASIRQQRNVRAWRVLKYVFEIIDPVIHRKCIQQSKIVPSIRASKRWRQLTFNFITDFRRSALVPVQFRDIPVPLGSKTLHPFQRACRFPARSVVRVFGHDPR